VSGQGAATRVRVDPVACDGFGYCAELVPELITLDEWGYPVLSETTVPRALEALVAKAVAQCPRRALFVEQVTPLEVPGPAVSRR
jgi:ferredoxin